MSIVLKVIRKHYLGRSILLPIVGQTTIAADGLLTIEDDAKAHEFVRILPDFVYNDPKSDDPNYVEPVAEALKEKSLTNELEQSNSGSQSIIDDLDEEEKKAMIEQLPGQTVKALQEFAGAFPSKEWRGKNKEQLIEFLTAKLS